MKATLLGASLLAAALSSPLSHAATLACGNVSDPVGDFINGPPDLVSGSVCIDTEDNAVLSVTFADGTSLSDILAVFVLDTDQNPATGFPGVDAANNDSALIGSDFQVWIYGSAFQGAADVFDSLVNLVGTVPVNYLGTTSTATVPLSMLGDDDGSMNFKIITAQQLSESPLITTTIRDYMPDLGIAPGAVSIPEPGTLALLGIGLFGLARRWR